MSAISCGSTKRAIDCEAVYSASTSRRIDATGRGLSGDHPVHAVAANRSRADGIRPGRRTVPPRSPVTWSIR